MLVCSGIFVSCFYAQACQQGGGFLFWQFHAFHVSIVLGIAGVA